MHSTALLQEPACVGVVEKGEAEGERQEQPLLVLCSSSDHPLLGGDRRGEPSSALTATQWNPKVPGTYSQGFSESSEDHPHPGRPLAHGHIWSSASYLYQWSVPGTRRRQGR